MKLLHIEFRAHDHQIRRASWMRQTGGKDAFVLGEVSFGEVSLGEVSLFRGVDHHKINTQP